MVQAYNDAIKDPELLSVRAEIALMDTLLAGLLPKLGSPENRGTWDDLKGTMSNVRRAVSNNDAHSLRNHLNHMDNIINANVQYYETEHEIKDTIDMRRRLVETEQKISLQGERSISVEQMMLLLTQVVQVIQTVVTEKDKRHAIAIGIQDLISLPQGDASPRG